MVSNLAIHVLWSSRRGNGRGRIWRETRSFKSQASGFRCPFRSSDNEKLNWPGEFVAAPFYYVNLGWIMIEDQVTYYTLLLSPLIPFKIYGLFFFLWRRRKRRKSSLAYTVNLSIDRANIQRLTRIWGKMKSRIHTSKILFNSTHQIRSRLLFKQHTH